MRLRTIALASIAVAGMGAASVATPAQAQMAEKDRHCVTNLSAPDTPTTCYDSFTVAIAKATGGRVTDAPDDARTAANDAHLAAQLNATGAKKDGMLVAAVSAVSIMWEDADFEGGTKTYTADSDCTATLDDVDFEVPLVTPESWNDEIGSYRAFRNCRLSLFEDINWTGASIPFAGDRSDVGILDDETSSIRWS